MRMKAEDKAKWLEALRSGEYEQIDGTLCRDGKYCCLGVLEVILDGRVEEKAEGVALGSPTCDFLDRHTIEIELRKDAIDLPHDPKFPVYAYGGTYGNLMGMNDELKIDDEGELIFGEHVYSFKDIADYIEQNVEVYD